MGTSKIEWTDATFTKGTMANLNTSIEWTDVTWSPVTGCTKVSPGCANCYAETVAKRFWKGRPFADVKFHEDRLFQQLHWRKPRRVFVNSMSDLFHEDLKSHQISDIFDVMMRAPQHTFQVLTKRAARMNEYMKDHPLFARPNVWLGVSVENQRMVYERIPILQDTPAAVRFLSVEPLLEHVELMPWQLDGVDWVIVGGESGRKARPCNVAWVRKVVEDCAAADVQCFVKQLGSNPVEAGDRHDPWLAIESDDGTRQIVLRDSKGGNWSEWPDRLRVREFPG